MSNIAFFGLGNMGAGMALNLVKAGHSVSVFDLVRDNVIALEKQGAIGAETIEDAANDAQIIISMLPASKHVLSLYFGNEMQGKGLGQCVKSPTLFIDCSTIEASAAKEISSRLRELGHAFIDAPVSGGVAGAAAGSLTFIVGGESQDVKTATPVLSDMGKHIFHAGECGAGQIAKICNNMLLAVLMTGTSEALNLAINNGLDPRVMSDIMLQSSGRNWTLEVYNPCPDVMPNVPSSNEYKPGFMVDLMNKDLGLAMRTALESESKTPMGKAAQVLFETQAENGHGSLDFSSVFNLFSK